MGKLSTWLSVAVVCCVVILALTMIVRSAFYGENSWKAYGDGPLFRAGLPSVSTESTIVYSSPRTDHGDIYSVDLAGTRQRLTVDSRFESQPVFAPDSSRVAFVRESRSCRHVWLMNKEGGGQVQLTKGAVLDDLVEFSPDGSWLLVSRSSALNIGLGRITRTYLIDLRNQANDPGLVGVWASFSPDSKHLVYGPADHPDEIWTMDIDGANRRKLGVGTLARFSPDGKSLVLIRGWDEIWLMNGLRTSPKHLVHGHSPTFTPTGDRIIYTADRNIWSVKTDGTERTKVEAPPGDKYLARSPTDAGLAFRLVNMGGQSPGSIWLLPFDTWQVEQIDTME